MSASDAAQRWGSILVGAAVLVVVTWMTVEASGPPRSRSAPKRDAGAEARAATTAAAAADSPVDGGGATTTESDGDGGLSLAALGLGDGGGELLMPSHAPRSVKLGVVLVAFAGAEGAPANARSKREALALAERLAEDARTDFHHAVGGGDLGSSDDVGRIPRGVLDPRTEVSVFALESGAVSDVLETPKGYWVVKRID